MSFGPMELRSLGFWRGLFLWLGTLFVLAAGILRRQIVNVEANAGSNGGSFSNVVEADECPLHQFGDFGLIGGQVRILVKPQLPATWTVLRQRLVMILDGIKNLGLALRTLELDSCNVGERNEGSGFAGHNFPRLPATCATFLGGESRGFVSHEAASAKDNKKGKRPS